MKIRQWTLLDIVCDIGPEEAVVFYTFLPEVFALVSLLEVELDDVLVVALCGNDHL